MHLVQSGARALHLLSFCTSSPWLVENVAILPAWRNVEVLTLRKKMLHTGDTESLNSCGV